ncbi:MAG: hypothetical protein JRN20_16020 [Nitrososphaerota archaeon]|nr:hypothetical protein [Nitrososphaerota archaeon]
MDTSAEISVATKEEAYFAAYSERVSKMKNWQLVGELANRMADLDDLEATDHDSAAVLFRNKTSRQVEILIEENQRRKKI